MPVEVANAPRCNSKTPLGFIHRAFSSHLLWNDKNSVRLLDLETLTAVGKVSYTCQDAWISNATMRDNITVGAPPRKELYDSCLDACALRPDIAELAGGDLADIGEKGVNLSGGQRARVSLARACYAGMDTWRIALLGRNTRGS